MVKSWRRKTARVVMVSLVAPLASMGPASTGGASMKVGSLVSIVAHDFQLNNEANATLNYSMLARHEGGSALLLDNAAFRAAKSAGFKTLEGARYYPFTGTISSSSAPPQSAYPLRFAVAAPIKSPPATPSAHRVCAGSADLLAFQKNSSGSPWRIVNEPFVPSASSIPAFATSSTGQGSFASGGDYSLPLNRVPATYIRAFANRARTGNGGALLPGSLFTYGHCGQFGLTDPHGLTGIHNGLRLTVKIAAASPSDLVTYQVVGGALAMFTLRDTVHESPIGAGHYIIWSHGSTTWWDLLPIGHYSSVQWTIDQELAVFVPSTSTGGTPRVLGQNGGVVTVSGVGLAG